MATLDVVSFNKLNVLQQSIMTNNNMSPDEKDDLLVMRKSPKVLGPSKEANGAEVLLTSSARKKNRSTSRDIGRVHNPPPMAVARRNARERNRVKQVNNGFATLRQHIPNAIAATFESGQSRGGNKKLSKVETLRMAVEYIRSLEDLLSSDEGEISINGSSVSASSISSYPSPASSSPPLVPQTSVVYTYHGMDEDDLTVVGVSSNHQYVKITGTNGAFPLIPTHQMFEDEENIQPLEVDLSRVKDEFLANPGLIEADLEFGASHDISLLGALHHGGSLSPSVYSDESLSPKMDNSNESFVPIFSSTTKNASPPSKAESSPPMHKVPSTSPSVIVAPTAPPPAASEGANISRGHQETMMDVMSWWEQEQRSQQHLT